MIASPRIIHVPEVDSTNDEARRRAAAGEAAPFWVRADRQTRGRGRRGRTWIGLEGNVFLSGVYRLACPAAEAAQLSFAAALAVAEALDAWVAPSRVSLKWPNDARLDGAKVGGVLLEAADAPRGVDLVVGVGVNVARAPEALSGRATALAAVLDAPPPAEEVAGAIVAGFEAWRRRWAEEGFGAMRTAWLARAHGLGERLTATVGRERLEGVFEDLDEDGALVMMTPAGRRLVRSGEVFFGREGAA